MKRALALALAGMLTGCVTDPERTPVEEYGEKYANYKFACVIRFPDRNGIPAAATCAEGQKRVAVGFSVEPIDGECEPAFMSLHGFRQIYGCVP